MTRPIEQPTTTADDTAMGGTRTRHPAFAKIGASRVSGRTNLFASDFSHNAYMTVTIMRCGQHRSLSNDWFFGGPELIRIAMTEAQWATFVSSPNVGDGVPCTLEHLQGEVVPGLPDPQPRTHQFEGEMKEKLSGTLEALANLRGEIEGAGLSKAKAAKMLEVVDHAAMQLRSNLPFVAEQFEEHMEATVEAAKAEIHGYMTGAVMRSGIASLAGSMPLELEGPPETV